MTLRKPITALFAVMALVAAALLGSTTPAAAADCPAGNFCMFTGTP
ncbi:hypothetical protein ACFZB6_29435 [Streptomyces syringium]